MTRVRAEALTHTGRKRPRNEDSYVVAPPLFAVADGMGGPQAGEVASRLAAEALRERRPNGGGESDVTALVQEANRRVYERSSEDAAVSGMGTTVTVALVDGGYVWIGHVGDSRAYLIRDGSLEQLTQDHSLVAELMRDGKLSAEEAKSHPQRSVITRALGTDPDVDVDTFRIEARPHDLFLICSDGLTTMVEDDAILRIAEENRDDLKAAAKALVNTANRGGGEDNITVVLFEIEDDPAEELAETKRMPALDDAAPDADEEDTLDELDAVPAVDTMVIPPSRVPDELREPAPAASAPARPDPRERTAKRMLAALALVVVLAILAVLLYWGLLS